MMSTYSDNEFDDSDDDEYYDYYDTTDVDDDVQESNDPEYFEFHCLCKEDVEEIFNENVKRLCDNLPVKPSLAKLLLHNHRWQTEDLITNYRSNATKLFVDSRIAPSKTQRSKVNRNSKTLLCSICFASYSREHFSGLACDHSFCKNCWLTYFEMRITRGISTAIECMDHDCNLLIPDDFVLGILNRSSLKEKYKIFSFFEYVKSHPLLRLCIGTDCNVIIYAKECQSKRVICGQCQSTFCFKCGTEYHAPLDCDTFKKWTRKCSDDSETANYIFAHTKDCPFCYSAIEKNGGCNHMVCWNCKEEFCWMCLGDWEDHINSNYSCSAYKESLVNESLQSEARQALSKYIFYFDRWSNHSKSLKLEEQHTQKIRDRISAKVMAKKGTWIDWHYLFDAAALLAKCRYSLKYTYPYAYYMETGSRKKLFEYQQAELEKEIECLSWKVERAETTDRAELENQMDITEKRRATLLKDFLIV